MPRTLLHVMAVVVLLAPGARAQSAPRAQADALIDFLVFGTVSRRPEPALFPPDVRPGIERVLRRWDSLEVTAVEPTDGAARLAFRASGRYERLLGAIGAVDSVATAREFVRELKPCYEWEGYHDCPERDAAFADSYQREHPTGGLSWYLPLFSAHRWMCVAEAHDREGNASAAGRARVNATARLADARASPDPVIRFAATHLAARGRCNS